MVGRVARVPVGTPVGDPPLPAGSARTAVPTRCEWCDEGIRAGAGVSMGDGSAAAAVCGWCLWRDLYPVRGIEHDNPYLWVPLGWQPSDIRLARAAGLTPAQARDLDPERHRDGWRMLAALRGTPADR